MTGSLVPQLRHPVVLLLLLAASLGFLPGSESQGLQNIYICKLYGANQVQNPGSPTCQGTAKLDFNTVTGSLFYDISVSGVSMPYAIGLYCGDPTTTSTTGTATFDNTAIINILTVTTHISTLSLGVYSFVGAVPVTVPLSIAIVQNPLQYYVEVFTAQYPFGACRCNIQTSDSSAQVSYSDANYNTWSGNDILP
eukprot:jgi/Mesen1/7539/ME000391S06774